MKQGRTLMELGKELQRQRRNRQDFLADTRTLEVETNSYGSTLHLSLEGKTYGFQIGELAHQQIAARLNIPFSGTTSKCRTRHPPCSTVTSTRGWKKSRNVE